MSVCVHFRTAKQLEPEQIFDEIARRGKKIMVTSPEFPYLKFGTLEEALRGIEINREENGYEVRICSFANRSDLQLYAAAVDVMKSLTGEMALYEDDTEQVITDPKAYLGEAWIKEQLERSLEVNCFLSRHYGKPIIMEGLFFPFCFGPALAKAFDLDLSDPCVEDIHSIQDYLVNLQWHFADKEGTSTRLAIPNPEGTDERPLDVSLIYAENGKVKPFDFVSYADVLCLMDKDNDAVMIRMEDFPKIAQHQGFKMMDDYQFAIESELSYETFRQMKNMARLYQVDDLFYRPTFPGKGYDDKQNTLVLMWNPAISEVKLEDHVNDIPNLLTKRFCWSVYDYEKAKKGDRFLMVRCGEGKTGIVMSGVFGSHPYEAADWSGKGRRTFCMDMIPNVILNPETAPMVTTKELQEAIPSFDWSGGHSGRLLTEEEARKIEVLWQQFMEKHKDQTDGFKMNAVHPNL